MNEPAAAARHSPSPPARPVRLGLISNARSGRNRRQLPRVAQIVADHPRILHYPTHDDAELTRALHALRDADVDVLALNGGDGTMAHVLGRILNERLFERLPPVALLPGGTTNMNAGDVGLHGNLRTALLRLRRWLDEPEPALRTERRPLLRLVAGHGHTPVYGMFFGAGAIIQGVEYCDRHTKGLENEIGPGLAIARTLWGIVRDDPRFAQPVTMTLRFDDTTARECKALLLIASGLERHFAGLQPFWGVEPLPVHATLIEASPRRFLRALPGLLRGRPAAWATPGAGYHSHNVQAIEFAMDGTVTLDGELFKVRPETGPGLLDKGADVEFLVL